MNQLEMTDKIKELFSKSPTLIETVALEAGNQAGAQRDETIKRLISMMDRMDDIDFQAYRKKIAKMVGLSISDLNAMLKQVREVAKEEKAKGEPTYTWGGTIGGWLVEYTYDRQTKKAGLAWRDSNRVIGFGDHVVIDGTLYEPFPPTKAIIHNAVIMPSKVGEQTEIRDLIADLELFIKSVYLLPNEQTARLIAYFCLSTWMYDAFQALVYLILMGDTGSGKSAMMERIGLVCYHCISSSGASSPSSFFRMTEKYKGTVLIDEGDLARSGTEQDMIKFYNLGAMKGKPIWKSVEVMLPNGMKDWEEQEFQTYCPKIATLKKKFADDAVISRSLVIPLQPKETIELVQAGISLNINEEMRYRANSLSTRLLRYRLENWEPEIEINPDWYELTISARLNQVAGILLALAKDDPEQQEQIRQNLRDYYRDSILTRSMTVTARVIESMWKIWKDKQLHNQMVKVDPTTEPARHLIKVGDITRITNSIMDEMNDEEEDDSDDDKKKKSDKDKIKPQRIGRVLRDELQFEITERRRDGFWVVWNETRLSGASMRFGVDPATIYPDQEDKKAAGAGVPEPEQPPEPIQNDLYGEGK